MAGFRKAEAQQAALKLGIYGAPGSGKTFTSLLIGEGLAKLAGKRMAFVDTEHGTDFYSKAVATRTAHPEAFDFDALYTRSITETIQSCRNLDAEMYGVVVLDSMTHLWQACIEAYGGRVTSAGTIPFQAWGKIKKPYKELMAWILSTPMHVIICGREGTEYATNEDTEELQAIGKKMKAEGETAYEPHILVRMEQVKAKKSGELSLSVAHVEKDRTGVLQGRSFVNPTFEDICRPLLPLLGATQAQMQSLELAAVVDADAIAQEEAARVERSANLLREQTANILKAADAAQLKAVGKLITPKLKAEMTPQDVEKLRETYLSRERELPKG